MTVNKLMKKQEELENVINELDREYKELVEYLNLINKDLENLTKQEYIKFNNAKEQENIESLIDLAKHILNASKKIKAKIENKSKLLKEIQTALSKFETGPIADIIYDYNILEK